MVQTRRFAYNCIFSGLLGQGGFGQVYSALFGREQESCAIKVIPADLRQGEEIESADVWSGVDVFERLQHLKSPHVLRYYDYWLEEEHPVSCQLQRQTSPKCLDRDCTDPTKFSSASFLEDDLYDGGFDLSPDGFEWENGDGPSLTTVASTPTRKSSSGDHSGVGSSRVFLHIRMEHCEGITLREWLYEPDKRAASGTNGLGAALNLCQQLLEGLVALHSEGIVHRDIKPDNLLLESATGHVRIFDFDISRLVQTDRNGQLTQGEGSPGYAAPEQWGDGSATTIAPPHPSADMFSVGVVFLELLLAASKSTTNKPLWDTAMERVQVMQGIRQGMLQLPEQLVGLPFRLRVLLLRMTNLDPTGRPSARQALREVTRFAEQCVQ